MQTPLESGVKLFYQDGESKESQAGGLDASGGTGLQGKSHFMAFSCGGPCKDRSFVSL